MKKLIAFIISVSAAAVLAPVCAASSAVVLNGREVGTAAESGADGGIAVPVRDLFEAAGFTVQWFSDESRVTAFTSDLNITMFGGDDVIYINGIGYKTDGRARIDNGSFVIPLSSAALALDADVDIAGGAVYINSAAAEDSSAWQYEVFDMINAVRAEYGLTPFIWNSDLAAAAYEHCSDMAARNYFSHNTPEGATPFERMTDMGIRYTAAAENIAAGQPDPESVVGAWMDSPSHRDNILNPKLTEIGIAFARGGKYGIYWAQEFAVTR